MKTWVGLGLIAAILILGLAFVAPFGLSLYHQERGGAMLDRALALEGYDIAEASWPLLWEPLTDRQARRQAIQATEHFSAAITADPDHAQPYRWQGRAALLLDDLMSAAQAFSEYARLKPDNPLGYWELGLAYERMARRLPNATYWHLDLEIDEPPDWTIISTVTETLTSSLESAYLETPDVVIETPYCEDGEPPASCFVGRDLWARPVVVPDPVLALTEPVQSEVLFMHPPSQATWELTLPVTPTAIAFWMGLAPQAETWWGDGVTFRVLVDGTEVFAHHLTAEQAQAGWRPAVADLSAWAGRTVRLTLATGPGPDGDGGGDWAGWGHVWMLGAAEAPYVAVAPARRAVAAWEKGGFTREAYVRVVEGE